jgi:hypothetical protein
MTARREISTRCPYINCTNCGPRYTVIEGLPYDRSNTTMKHWPMDAACAVPYSAPSASPVSRPADRVPPAGAPDVLVMTSANRSSEAIAYEDDAARQQLSGIADSFLIGERPIARRVDDSVARVGTFGPVVLRRSRGYAPGAVAKLPFPGPILAVGADLKNTITLVVEGQAFVSQHIGDLDDYSSLQAFQQTIRDLVSMYEVSWEDLLVVRDLHPNMLPRFTRSVCRPRKSVPSNIIGRISRQCSLKEKRGTNGWSGSALMGRVMAMTARSGVASSSPAVWPRVFDESCTCARLCFPEATQPRAILSNAQQAFFLRSMDFPRLPRRPFLFRGATSMQSN